MARPFGDTRESISFVYETPDRRRTLKSKGRRPDANSHATGGTGTFEVRPTFVVVYADSRHRAVCAELRSCTHQLLQASATITIPGHTALGIVEDASDQRFSNHQNRLAENAPSDLPKMTGAES